MTFTVKRIFPALNLPEEELNKHRTAVGMHVRDSWDYRYESPPSKIEEDGVLVNCYDDEFEDQATEIIKRYVSEQALDSPKAEPKKKRPRITLQPVYQPLK